MTLVGGSRSRSASTRCRLLRDPRRLTSVPALPFEDAGASSRCATGTFRRPIRSRDLCTLLCAGGANCASVRAPQCVPRRWSGTSAAHTRHPAPASGVEISPSAFLLSSASPPCSTTLVDVGRSRRRRCRSSSSVHDLWRTRFGGDANHRRANRRSRNAIHVFCGRPADRRPRLTGFSAVPRRPPRSPTQCASCARTKCSTSQPRRARVREMS